MKQRMSLGKDSDGLLLLPCLEQKSGLLWNLMVFVSSLSSFCKMEHMWMKNVLCIQNRVKENSKRALAASLA